MRKAWLFLVGEKLFSILLFLYIGLLVVDPSLFPRTLSYLNVNALSTILALMLVSHGLEFSGFFNRLTLWVLNVSKGSIVKLYLLVIFFSALVSAIIMNDTALFIFAPFVVSLSRYLGDVGYLLVLTTISANIGSSLTPIGNPQNIIIWQHYGVSFIDFIYSLLPFFFTAIIVLTIYSVIGARKLGSAITYRNAKIPRIRVDKTLLFTSIILLILNVLLAQMGLQVYGLIITISLYLIIKRTVVYGLDYVLILIFAFMFVDFKEISHIVDSMGLIPSLDSPLTIVLLSSLLSQVISNVPATITLIEHVALAHWKALAVGVNLGGVGLLTGSMANIITLRIGGINVKVFHKYSLPYFIVLFCITVLLTLCCVYS